MEVAVDGGTKWLSNTFVLAAIVLGQAVEIVQQEQLIYKTDVVVEGRRVLWPGEALTKY